MKWVVTEHQQILGEWAKRRIGPYVETWGPFQAIGLITETEILAVAIYNEFCTRSCCIHLAAVDGKRWLNREFLRACFEYPFNQLNYTRLTGYVAEKNLAAQKLDEHLGFVREGLLREQLPDDNVIVYGMLKSECRFINHGRKRETTGTTDAGSVSNGGSTDAREHTERGVCSGSQPNELLRAYG